MTEKTASEVREKNAKNINNHFFTISKIIRKNSKIHLRDFFSIDFLIGIKTIVHGQMTGKFALEVRPKNGQQLQKCFFSLGDQKTVPHEI